MPIVKKTIKAGNWTHPTEPNISFDYRLLTGVEMGPAQGLGPGSSEVDRIAAYAGLLGSAILAWTYEEELTAENLADLDNWTRDWLFLQIVKMNSYDPESIENLGGSSADTTTLDRPEAGQSS